MYIMISHRKKDHRELWAGETVCPICGKQSDFYTHREVTTSSIFFIIPVISFTSGRAIVCENCGHAKSIKGKEYKELEKKQISMLEERTYPRDRVQIDCSPQKTRLGLAIFKLIILALFAFIFLTPTLGVAFSNTSLNSSALIMFLPFSILCCLPFYFSLRRFLVLLKMNNAYKNSF